MNRVSLESAQALFIEMMFNDQQLATGTAFLVKLGDKFFLVTNRHNFTCRSQHDNQPLYQHGGIPNKVKVWHHQVEVGKYEPHIYGILDPDENRLWFEHPFLGPTADMAALKIAIPAHVATYPVDIEEPPIEIWLRPSDLISVIGYPFGLGGGSSFATWATGFVASEPDLDHGGDPVFLIDCRSRQGQSGSPVMAVRHGSYQSADGALTAGDVSVFLGIYSGRINSESDLGKVWKRTAVRQLVHGAAQKNTPFLGIGIKARWDAPSPFKWQSEPRPNSDW